MQLSGRLVVVVVLVVAAGCEKAKDAPPPTPPTPPTPAQQLTERDVEPHGGALVGDGWRLPLDDRWFSVKAEKRAAFKPTTQAWAADPVGPVHVTVECRESKDSVEATLRGQLALGREQSGIEGVALGPLGDGPWLEGALAQWVVGDVAHALGRFRLVAATCDVHAWGPKSGGQPLADRLRSTVVAFGSTRPGFVAELNRLADVLQRRAQPDAGPAWVRLLVEDALKQAPAPLLVERFTMRLQLLETVNALDCALIVRHRFEESPRMLDQLPEPVAVRWVEVTREALRVAAGRDAGAQPTAEELKKAELALEARDQEYTAAVDALRHADMVPASAACEAEKLRLKTILAQPPAQRALLLRGLL